jgi:hypothetical protein
MPLMNSSHGGSSIRSSRHSISPEDVIEQDATVAEGDSDKKPPGTEETNDASLNHSDQEYPFSVGDVTCWKAVRSPMDFAKLTAGWLMQNKSQILSGLTVALAQVPEAVSFSFVAGVDPIVGLQSAWIMGICTSLAGGRPGMVVRFIQLYLVSLTHI